MSAELLILPGDGIGPEVTAEAEKLLSVLRDRFALKVRWSRGLIGGAAYDACGEPLPAQTLEAARAADAVLLGAVGGPNYDRLPRDQRPERGLLGIRAAMGLFSNLRPAILYPELASASSLKPERVAGLDILIVRELTGGIYFGQPRGIEIRGDQRVGINTEVYAEFEIERIARSAFAAARLRSRRLCSVDKANVLESSELWREVVSRVGSEFPDVSLTHLLVDNAAMQLVRAPKQFDVIVTSNLFGDILSDIAAQLTGSIGMLPSASLDASGRGLYEPIHGSAPDIAGQGVANPLAMIGSVAMMLRYTLGRDDLAQQLDGAIRRTLKDGMRTRDIALGTESAVSTCQMGDAVAANLCA